ncbi:MAG: hypothetical protein ACOZNI_08800 [Myxococcota bacterium]
MSSTEPAAIDSRIGRSPRGKVVNTALLALSRAARSVPLYQPRSQTVRQLVGEYRDRMREALQPGDLVLDVRPFELVLLREVVYLERDRERSLAYRLFRDGIRKLTIQSRVPWGELVTLLEILTTRFGAVRAAEDDCVTMIWKAGFTRIQIVAVEGFVEDDPERDAAGAGGEKAEGPVVEVPRDWDLPVPVIPRPVAWGRRAVDEARVARLRDEAAAASLADASLGLVRELLAVVADPTDPTAFRDVASFCAEVRDFLLQEGDLGKAAELAGLLQGARPGAREAVDAVLAGFAGPKTARAIWARAAQDAGDPRALLDVLPGDHLPGLLELAVTAAEPTALLNLLPAWLPERAEEIGARLGDLPAHVAIPLVPRLAEARPQRAIEWALDLCARPELPAKAAARAVLQANRPTAADRARLLELARADAEEMRRLAIELLGELRDASLYAELGARLAARSASPAEAAALGRAMARSDPAAAERDMVEWIRPRNLWKQWFQLPKDEKLQYAAVAGLLDVSPQRYDDLVRWLHKRAGAALADACMRALAQARRKEGSLG